MTLISEDKEWEVTFSLSSEQRTSSRNSLAEETPSKTSLMMTKMKCLALGVSAENRKVEVRRNKLKAIRIGTHSVSLDLGDLATSEDLAISEISEASTRALMTTKMTSPVSGEGSVPSLPALSQVGVQGQLPLRPKLTSKMGRK